MWVAVGREGPDVSQDCRIDKEARGFEQRCVAGCTFSSMRRRLWAVAAIAVGAAVIGFNPNRWDLVILTLPRDHGVHIRDLAGIALIAAGTAILWRSPPL